MTPSVDDLLTAAAALTAFTAGQLGARRYLGRKASTRPERPVAAELAGTGPHWPGMQQLNSSKRPE